MERSASADDYSRMVQERGLVEAMAKAAHWEAEGVDRADQEADGDWTVVCQIGESVATQERGKDSWRADRCTAEANAEGSIARYAVGAEEEQS